MMNLTRCENGHFYDADTSAAALTAIRAARHFQSTVAPVQCRAAVQRSPL